MIGVPTIVCTRTNDFLPFLGPLWLVMDEYRQVSNPAPCKRCGSRHIDNEVRILTYQIKTLIVLLGKIISFQQSVDRSKQQNHTHNLRLSNKMATGAKPFVLLAEVFTKADKRSEV